MSSFLDTALATHIDFKARLKSAVATGAGMTSTDAAVDDTCALGGWLRGEGRGAHASKPEFSSLTASHTAFHRTAGEALRLAESGHRKAAEEAVEIGDFAMASLAVSRDINALRKTI